MAGTKGVGDTTVAMVLASLLKANKPVLIPFGDNLRYDLAVDEEGRLIRVQCKTGRLCREAVVFRTCSTHYHRKHTSRGYKGEADVFGVYVPATNKVYLVPVADVPERAAHLRLTAPKNNQTKRIRMASAYELTLP